MGRLTLLAGELLGSVGSALFIGRRRSGIFLLAALLTSPLHAASGLLGLLVARLVSSWLMPGNVYLKIGLPQGAGLLTGLALATFLVSHPNLLVLVPVAATLAALIVHAFYPLLGARGLPGLALSFVLATWILLATAPALGFVAKPVAGSLELPWLVVQMENWLESLLPELLQLYLKSFGSLLFLPTLSSGLLVLAGLLAGSRITALAMVAGGAIGIALLRLLSGSALDSAAFGLIAFNSILTAAALCGIFLVISRRSLVYALAALVASVFLTAALSHLLAGFRLPVLAFPFTLTVWLFLLPLRSGMLDSARHDIWAPPLHLVGVAERNLRAFERWRRDTESPGPVLSLPLHGDWKITQGPGGGVTHNSATGREAWDFMLLDEQGRSARWPGEELESFYGYGVPVLAPGEGTVTAVEGSLPDNPVHVANTEQPWGNWIMITHDTGTVSLLAHLRAGSIRLLPGQRVTRGQEIAQVGNSGRSPEPHLHYQLNDSPWLAGRSLPAVFAAWVELGGSTPVFHALGRPAEDMIVCSLASLDWEDWSGFFPFSIPGRSWRVRCSSGRRETVVQLRLVSGSGGRLLLDDGDSVAQVLWWPGWLQLHDLVEADPDRRPGEGSGLVAWMLATMPALPLKGVAGLGQKGESWSTLVSGRTRRAFGLESKLELECHYRLEQDGQALSASLIGHREKGATLTVQWRAMQRVGLRALVASEQDRELFRAEWLDE